LSCIEDWGDWGGRLCLQPMVQHGEISFIEPPPAHHEKNETRYFPCE
jgi:hypothetical protein